MSELLGRAPGYDRTRPLHRVRCACGRVYVACMHPKAIRCLAVCASCRVHDKFPQRGQRRGPRGKFAGGAP